MKKWIAIIIVVLAIAAGVGYGVKASHSSQVQYNDTYVNGNTAGNLYNAGLFCESNGTVFFANPDDDYRLYSMDLDGSNLKKLCNDTVMYINADSHYLYYVRNNEKGTTSFGFFTFNNNSLCRMDRDGSNVIVLDQDPCIYATLIGNYVYYLHYDTETATTLYKVGIDGEDKKQVYSPYLFTCSTLGQYFYSSGSGSDSALYQYDTSNDQMSKIYDCTCYKPIVLSTDNVYYMDVDQDYALVHTNIQADNPVKLTSDSVDLYNVYGSYIYYQRYSETDPALCMIKNDGSEYRIIARGNYSAINVTSYYIYVTDFETKQVYFTSTSNPGSLQEFHPGVISE
jgi:hypothetical protein